MSKFFVVFAVPNHADDFEITGVFTNEADATTFADELNLSRKFQAVGRPQHLEMPEILDILVRDRLRELAVPIAKLAASVRVESEVK
jgi:hypothetical protein